jgi:aminoglycoside 3-N-acetyltransferase I
MNTPITTRTLDASDIPTFRSMLLLFGEAFEDQETYATKQPNDEYIRQLFASENFIAIVAEQEARVIGALAGYVLPKFEQARSEFYIYDLAVGLKHRRQGVATALIEQLKAICQRRGIYVIFVQADYGDDAAVALYTKLGSREDVMHFDISPNTRAA